MSATENTMQNLRVTSFSWERVCLTLRFDGQAVGLPHLGDRKHFVTGISPHVYFRLHLVSSDYCQRGDQAQDTSACMFFVQVVYFLAMSRDHLVRPGVIRCATHAPNRR